MEIPPKKNSFTAKLSGLKANNDNIQLNQQISAQVVKRLDNGHHLLKVQNQLITTQLDKALQPGQKINIEILRLGDPATVKITNTPSTNKENLTNSVVSNTLKSLLPQQQALTPLFKALNQLMSKTNLLPQSLSSNLEKILAYAPESKHIQNAQTMRNAIQYSGLFFDQQILANNKHTLAGFFDKDLKANLLRLKELLQTHLQKQTPNSAETQQQSSNKNQASTYSPNTKQTTHFNPAKISAMQNFLASVQMAKQDSNNLKSGLLSIDQQLSLSTLLKTINDNKPLNSSSTLNLLKQLESQLQHLATLPPLRQFFPQALSNEAIAAKHLDSTENLLRFLLRQVDGVLARTQISQLSSLPQEGDNKSTWLFEIPIRRNDEITVFQLRIEYEQQQQHEQQKNKPEEKLWSIYIAFDLSGLGPVYIKLNLQADKITSNFWLQQSDTLSLFEKHLPSLIERLQSLGFETGHFNCLRGQPPSPTASQGMDDYLDENA